MAQNGFMPSVARPAAKVTPCCSAMPTSKQRSGKAWPKRLSPVPDGIAAVMATMRSSCFASSMSALAKTFWYDGATDFALLCTPVTTSNLTTP